MVRSTPRRPPRGCAGATTIRRPSSRTRGCARRTPGAARERPRVRARRHRRLRRRPLLADHGGLRQGGAATTSACASASATPGRRRPSCTCCRRCGSATAGPGRTDVPRPVDPRAPAATRRARPARSPKTSSSAAGGSPPAPIPPAARPRCSSARTRPTSRALFGARRARRRIPRTASTTTSSHGARDRQSRPARHEDGVLVPRHRRAGRDRRARLRLARDDVRRARSISAPASTRRSPIASGRPTSIYAALRPAGRERRRGGGDAPGLRRHGLEPAVLPLRRRALARRRPGRRRRPRRASPGATPAGATSTTATSSPCPTSGSTPGTPPGTSPSTASCSRTSTRRRRSTSCCCSAASGTCTRTASCRPTSGSSAT